MEGFFGLTGSYNAGIAVYSLLQMLLLAWALSSAVGFMALPQATARTGSVRSTIYSPLFRGEDLDTLYRFVEEESLSQYKPTVS